MKISYYALGCKVNLYEAEAIVKIFTDNGFILSSFDDVCDVYLINTCTVTLTSDSKSRKIIRQAVKRNKNAVIVVMGCYSSLNKDAVSKIEGVDIVLGTSQRLLAYPLVMDYLKTKNKYIFEKECFDKYEELKVDKFSHKTRGFVKIEDGCNNFCSYCAIPYARGRVRSRDKDNIIEEINHFVNGGMKEIVLSGINTGAYGSDLDNYSLSNLLKDIINEVNKPFKMRISSIEITEITDDLLNVISENKEYFCDHFHIPLQGGCDNTLKRMNRKYDLKTYEEKINKIRNIFPLANITTDVLTSFSGETKEDFNNSIDFIKKIGYGEMHVFPYSRRKGTKAYLFDDIVNDEEKQQRVSTLLSLNKNLALIYRKKFIGELLDVLVEKNENGYAFGHTSNYIEVSFKSNAQNNDIIKVKIVKADYPVSIGEEYEI